jgi:chromosome segregation protein
VLRERMSAREVGRLETVRAFIGRNGSGSDAPPARLAFFTPTAAPTPGSMNHLPRLFDLLRLGDASLAAILGDWLAGVYTAPDLDAALASRGELEHGEVIMTREGHAVGPFSVAFYAPDSEAAGLLARAQEIENLEREVRAQQILAEQARAEVAATEAGHADTAGRLAAARREAAEQQSAAHAAEVELMRLTQAAEQATSRLAQLGDERVTLLAEARELEARRVEEDERFQALDAELAGAQQADAELEDAVHVADRALETSRAMLRERERAAQEAAFERRSLAARVVELERAIATAGEQMAAKARADERLADELAALADDTATAELDAALAVKLDREAALGRQRSVYDDLAGQLRAADEQRMGHEQALQPLRDRLGALQLEAQAARLGGAQYAERLDAAGADRGSIQASIEQGGVRLHGLAGRIDALGREIESLGAVNLAALDELGQARDRKGFLDAQNADLTDAMQTLENAIRTIDLETRELLQTTFDTVNGHFGRMFPVLFGGGTAKLAMTGDEILDAGVQVMAQPPGKKNASIHLLSGGEKALTAIALVFAIFQLNPAPFCLLDEVDAPLDDANTERYARLVTEMSAATQFVFISHNRIAMEMAAQLIGVTMQEQGVSRIVSVDMPHAMKLAEAA